MNGFTMCKDEQADVRGREKLLTSFDESSKYLRSVTSRTSTANRVFSVVVSYHTIRSVDKQRVQRKDKWYRIVRPIFTLI